MDFLDLLGVPYHAPGVFFLGTDFLFKSILAFCDKSFFAYFFRKIDVPLLCDPVLFNKHNKGK